MEYIHVAVLLNIKRLVTWQKALENNHASISCACQAMYIAYNVRLKLLPFHLDGAEIVIGLKQTNTALCCGRKANRTANISQEKLNQTVGYSVCLDGLTGWEWGVKRHDRKAVIVCH